MRSSQKNQKQLPFSTFASIYKLIRHERNSHLGEYMLMRNLQSKRLSIVKKHKCSSIKQLSIILQDFGKLTKMYSECENLCHFVGYAIEQTHQDILINIIYDHQKNTLQQQIGNMALKKQVFTENQIDVFILCMLNAFKTLQKYGLNHQCLKQDNVLIGNRGTIGLTFRLFYTPYITEASNEIKKNRFKIEEYNLSEKQILSINSKNKSTSLVTETTFPERLYSDKQSLGILVLRMATFSCETISGKLHNSVYALNQNSQITWDFSQLKNRIQLMISNYSVQLIKKLEYLLFDRTFYSFRDLPSFMNLKISGLNQGSISRIKTKDEKNYYDTLKNSNSPHSMSSSKHETKSSNLDKVSSEQKYARLSPFNQRRTSKSPVSRLRGQTYDIGTNENMQFQQHNRSYSSLSPSRFSTGSAVGTTPSKQKASLYSELKRRIQTQINQVISNCEQKSNITKIKCPDGAEYLGTLSPNGQKCGQGICYYPEGDIYAGQWKNDQMEGKGTYLFQNCDMYKGEVSKGKKQGSGKYLYSNGSYYQGLWQADTKNGYGVYFNAQKQQKYEGGWLNGLKHGQGRYTWSNGDKYEGQFSNGIKNGPGQCFKSDGTVLKGNWHNDTIRGTAAITYRSGANSTGQISINQGNIITIQGRCSEILQDGTKYEGEYLNGKRSGFLNKIVFANGDSYCGSMKQNKFEGEGTYYYRSLNCTYKGRWSKGLQSGVGRLQFNQNKSSIQCQWIQGRPSKLGKILYENGDYYEGQINRLGRHGNGTYYRANGQKIYGLFKNNLFIYTT